MGRSLRALFAFAALLLAAPAQADDPAGDTLGVADRWSGLIHRFRMDGSEIALYDRGVALRPAAGLRASPASLELPDPQSPAFDSTKPETSGAAPPERRPFGVAVRGGRLYYAIAAGLEIWSVSLAPDGAFGPDARREVVVPPGDAPSEISGIAFDDAGGAEARRARGLDKLARAAILPKRRPNVGVLSSAAR